MAKKKSSPQAATAVDLMQQGAWNPVWFMEDCCGWGLWEKQREICEALLVHERVAVPAAFGVGKTYLAARIAAWWLATHRGSQVVTTAATARQVKDLLWAELRSAVRQSRIPLGGELLQTEWRLGDKWFATGFATSPEDVDKFTGYHSPYMLVIFDQACGLAKNAWVGGEGLVTSGNTRWLAISNTTEEDSEFANLCIPGRRSEFGKWHIIRISAHDSPNVLAGRDIIPGIIAHDWVEKKRSVWPSHEPFWQIFVEAQFVEGSSMTVMTPQMIAEISNLDLEPDFENIVIGVDVADQGIDRTVFTVRAGPRLLFIESATGNDPMQVVDHMVRVWKKVRRLTEHLPIAVRVDKIGVGSGVAARISQLGYPVIGVNVGVVPTDTEQFLNLRAELAWGVRHLAEGRLMSLKPYFHTEDEYMNYLKEELTLRYKLLVTGKIQLESKDDIRKRLRRSSDFFDSLVLCYAMEGIVPVGTVINPNPERDEDMFEGKLMRDLLEADKERAMRSFLGGEALEPDWREIG